MSIASDPREERAYARALAKLVEHVVACTRDVKMAGDVSCGMTPTCPHGKVLGDPRGPRGALGCSCCGSNLVDVATGTCLECADPSSVVASPVYDVSDPSTPLCPRGAELRAAALAARAATPSERLISFYALESPDVPPADAHDCARAAAWLRGDPGEARVILERLVERAGPLEEREEPTPDLREAFLVGFRRRFPSRGPAPTEEQRARRAAAADRLVAAIAERYVNRHGAPAPADAIEAFRRSHDLWIQGDTGMGDLERLADDVERFRAEHPRLWGLRALLPPRDPLRELRKIARWVSEEMIKGEAGRG